MSRCLGAAVIGRNPGDPSAGQIEEARDFLAPVHGWFTEGFDTPDLKDAKALLEELA